MFERKGFVYKFVDMENKVLFLDPLHIQPSFKCGTEGLIGASILGATGLTSGILGSSSASSNNARTSEYYKPEHPSEPNDYIQSYEHY